MKKLLPIILMMLAFSAKSQIWNDVTVSAGLNTSSNFVTSNFDFNNDGYIDFFTATNSYRGGISAYLFYKNNTNNTFSDVTTNIGMSGLDSGSCITTDYNNDGYTDIVFFSSWHRTTTNDLKVYKNNSGQTFSDVTSQVGISSDYFSTTDTILSAPRSFDYDKDGDLDLVFMIKKNNQIFLKALVNQKISGGYQFSSTVNIISLNGINAQYSSFEFFDMDNDNDFDVIIDFALSNQYQNGITKLYRNNGATFTDVTSNSGIPASLPSEMTAIDINNDGNLDIVKGGADCCTGSLYKVLIGNGNGVFVDANLSYPITGQGYKDFGTLVDYDNDGDFDFNWSYYTSTGSAPFRLWRNNGSNTYTEIAATYGLNLGVLSGGVPITTAGYSSWMDYDNDGDLDILLSRTGAIGSSAIWLKQNPIGGNYLNIKLQKCGIKSSTIGARVMIKVSGSKRWLYRGVQGGEGVSNKYSEIFHFGLGTATSIDTLRVYWPTGQIVDYFPGINQTFTATLNTNCEVNNTCIANITNNDTTICRGSSITLNAAAVNAASVTDINGNVYPSVNIGAQTWSSKNLNVSKYKNGVAIPQVTDSATWRNLTTGAWCWYNNDSANYASKGKLYNWFAVNDSRGIAPDGWHVPTDGEWNKMIKFLDPLADTVCGGCAQSTTAGGALKQTGTTNWGSPNGGATNASGFNAIASGFRDTRFLNSTYNAYWWSATTNPSNSNNSWSHAVSADDANEARIGNVKYNGYSVRVVRNATTYLWSTGATTQTISVAPTVTTTYYVTINNGFTTCTDSVKVTVSTITTNLITADTIKVCGTSTTISATTGLASYAWSNGANTASTTVTSSGWYKCTASNGACTAKDSVYVSLFNPKITQNDTTICASNSITLNATGVGSFSVGSSLPNNLQNGLIANYPLDGADLRDFTSNGNNATFAGTGTSPTATTDRFGRTAKALLFGPNSAYVQASHRDYLNAFPITVSCWYQTDSLYRGSSLVSKYYSAAWNGWASYITNGGIYPLYTRSRSNYVIGGYDNQPSFGYVNRINDGNWHHFLFKVDSLKGYTYIDGVLVSTISWTGPFGRVTSGYPLTIGTYLSSNSGEGAFSGKIDDVLIFNRALSQTEINQVYTGGGSYTYLWSTTATTQSITVNPTATTSYIATVSNGINTCKDTVKITVAPFTTNLITADTIKVCGTSTTISATTGLTSYAWSNGANTASTTVTSSGWYKCTATNGACTAKDSVYVSLFNPKITQNDTTVCGGAILTLNLNTTVFNNNNNKTASFNNNPLNAVNFVYSDLTRPVSNFSYDFWFNTTRTISLLSEKTGGVSVQAVNGQNFALLPGFSNTPYFHGSGISVGTNGISVVEHSGNFFDARLTYASTLNGWHHCAVVYTNNGFSMYLDGQLIGSRSNGNNYGGAGTTYGTAALLQSVGVGYPNYDANDNYTGKIDELRHWNVSLTGTQISQIYNRKLTSTNLSQCLLNLNFDQASLVNSISNSRGPVISNTNLPVFAVESIPQIGIFQGNSISSISTSGFNNSTSVIWSTTATTPSITVNPTATTSFIATVSNGINTCKDTVKITVANITSLSPTTIFGIVDVCASIGADTASIPVNYKINKVANAASYVWTVPAGVTLLSGQGDTSILVRFSASFVSGAITVKSVSICNISSALKSVTVYKRVATPATAIQKEFTPTSILATTNVTGLVTEVYRIKKVLYATSYNWYLNRGTNARITHINAAGVNDTAVIVTFASCFVKDTLSVKSITPCSISSAKTVIMSSSTTPANVAGITTVGGDFAVCIGSSKTFTAIVSTPTTAQVAIASFRWTKPLNTIITSATSDSSSITVSFNAGFTGGNITAKGVSSCGVIGTTAFTAIIQYLPLTPLSIGSSTNSYNACINSSVTYTALVGAPTSTQAPASVFRWTRPNNTTITSASADSSSITVRFNTGYTGGIISVKGQSRCGSQGAVRAQTLTHTGCAIGTKMSQPITTTNTPSFEVSLYPNPTTNEFKLLIKNNAVVGSNKQSKAIIKVIDVQGRMMKSFTTNTNQVTAIGNELKPGVYMVEVRLGDEVKVVRAVKF